MSELDVFESQVRERIRQLDSPKAGIRRKAAAWLGEAGDPSAIKRLTQVYESDPNAKVRAAAAYSLGMFRALEREMQGDDPDPVYELLEDIALRGQMGRRVPIPMGCMARLALGLLVSLLLLLAFNFLIWPEYGPQIDSVLIAGGGVPQAAAGRTGVIADLSDLLDDVRADATALQAQYADVSTVNCDAEFTSPIAYDVSEIDTDLMTIGSSLNAQVVQLAISKVSFNQACASDSPVLTADQVSVPLTNLEAILAALPAIEADLDTARSGAPPTAEAPVATLESAGDDATPTEPGPTEMVADPKSHLPVLFSGLDEIRSTSGAYTLLQAFWDGVSDNPVNSGCANPVPAIDSDYILPEVDATASPDLKLGVELYNTGLGLTRQGWAGVATACNGGDLMGSRENGLILAANARISFESAETLFTQVRDR